MHAACQRSADKANELLAAQQEYNELKERIDRLMEETQEPTPPPVPSVSNPADVPVDSNEHGIDMDLNNPGIDEENEDGAGPAVKRKRLSHFDQMMAGLSHFDNESLATFLGHVQQQTGIAQEAEGARGSGDTSMNVIVGSGDQKDTVFKPQSKLGENFPIFSGYAGQNRSPPSVSGPEGFQEKQSTSSYCPSFLRHVPASVAEEFKDPEFCKNVAGLERMLRVRARSHSAGSPAHRAGTCLSTFERNGSLLPELVAVSQESSLDRSHSSAVGVGDSVVESLVIGKHDFEDGIVEAGHPPSGASCAGLVFLFLLRLLLAVLTPRLQRLQVKGLHLDCLR